MLYHRKDPEKRVDLLLGPKGISAVNTGGTTIHSGLRIEPETMENKAGLNGKSKVDWEICYQKWKF